MANRKYNRVFVLMMGKSAGQSLNGSCDMEVIDGRGRLYAYVGKLNKLTYTPRNLYLISVGLKGSMAVSAGAFVPKGRNASINVEFDPDNLFGSGISFEEVNAIAVWNEKDGPNNTILEGFVSKRLNWHSGLEIYGDTKYIVNNNSVLEDNKKEELISPVFEKTEELVRNYDDFTSKIEEPEIEAINVDEEIENKNQEIIEDTTYLEYETEPETHEHNIDDVSKEECIDIANDNKIENQILEVKDSICEEENVELNNNLSESIAAAESMVDVSPHDTFRAIAQRFRRELDMLDEMGIIDKSMFFDEKETATEQASSSQKSTEKVDLNNNDKVAKNVGVSNQGNSMNMENLMKAAETIKAVMPMKKNEPAKKNERVNQASEHIESKNINAKATQAKTTRIEEVGASKTEKILKEVVTENIDKKVATESIDKKVETVKQEDKSASVEKTKLNFTEMTPTDRLFITNNKLITDDGREWVKIDYREAYFIDDAIKDIRCYFVRNAARKSKHMILGRNGRDIFIGVPGSESERNKAEKNGFDDFLTVNGSADIGYWIKAI